MPPIDIEIELREQVRGVLDELFEIADGDLSDDDIRDAARVAVDAWAPELEVDDAE